MMRLAVISLFPEIFQAYMGAGIMRRAAEKSLVGFEVLHLRDFAAGRHRIVDDYPYGGGPGMVIKPEPVYEAVKYAKRDGLPTLTILLSPQGKPFTQRMADELSGEKGKRRLLFICGRYEGIDERVRASLVDEEISTGDYVLTGGELPALVIIDAVVRLLPGALGDEDSLKEESFSWGILDYPHYTRPPEWNGMRVPEVLLSGNHGQIALWRRKEALRRTLRKRPELLRMAGLTPKDQELIGKIKEEDYEPGK
ncbi:MAG: tRNA (guanosine(37)-N1)-methyltransferase TrmD [Nitrospiraceae bacterium]|nr:tRNA (guanosine(37)-N1)-methyltransferase TrmD [Nitrospiraceae bacterium]